MNTQAQTIVLLQVLVTYVSSMVYFFDPSWSNSGDPVFNQTGDVILVLMNSLIFLFLSYVLCRVIRSSTSSRQLVDSKGIEAHATRLDAENDFHLFLSHTWGSGQDQMRVAKQLLLEAVPDLSIFLDVDDLKEGKGGEYVRSSQNVLIFCSEGYFNSVNCMRELLCAVFLGKPLITLVEPEVRHGGLTPLLRAARAGRRASRLVDGAALQGPRRDDAAGMPSPAISRHLPPSPLAACI